MKLTQEQLAELIAKVFTNLDEKRKARKEDGEAVSEGISTEEILAEVTAILEGEGGVTDPTATSDPTTNPAPALTADPIGGDNSALPSSRLLRVRASRAPLAPVRRSPAAPVFRSRPSASTPTCFSLPALVPTA